ncbi:hypothetical protein PsYK624_118700 [Phanerochaete sordida]|uniref:F-box domain-containing protein n=1 Tax=Phanerochaete sordida TaxID=48140 RepID=A0A9P3GK03_9APHY|nr:hypothetical protein PsYK624_118700 [Phanerochaete sordida]
MDVLWSVVQDGDRLVHVFPEGILNRVVTNYKPEMSFARLPSRDEWRRFEQYSRRVRVLYCYAAVLSFMSLRSGDIAKHLHGGQLFPNLHTLQLFERISFDPCSLLVRPPLRHLRLHYMDANAVEAIVDALPGCVMLLETIIIHGNAHRHSSCFERLSSKFSTALLTTHKLTELDAALAFPRAVHHLSTLSTMRILSLSDLVVPDAATLPFPALEALQLWVAPGGFPSLLPFLEKLGAPSLQEFRASNIREGYGTVVHFHANQMHAMICEFSRFSQLRVLAFPGVTWRWLPSLGRTPLIDGLLSENVLEPLYSLRALKELKLGNFPIRLTSDEIIEQMARAWPQIEELWVTFYVSTLHFIAREDLLQVDAMLPFARSCPKLTALGLPISISRTPLHVPELLPKHPRLQILCLIDIGPNVTEETVDLLAQVFPNMTVTLMGFDAERRDLNDRMLEKRKALASDVVDEGGLEI